jgi:hypothetical protein
MTNSEQDKAITDPWDGFPDTPWTLDGYSLDDAICDHIMMVRGRHDGRHFENGEDALNSLLELVRSRRFDA